MSIQHRQRFQKGRVTPEEFHQKYAFPAGSKCEVCSSPPLTRVRILMPIDELRKSDALFDELCTRDPIGVSKTFVMTKNGPYVRVTTVYACKQHTPEIEKAAAQGPSWAIVEINRGPGVDNPKVGGGTNLPT